MTILSFRVVRLLGCLGGALLVAQLALAQRTDPVPDTPTPALDDITERTVVAEHRVLKYQPIREADILWEKRLWRVIDTREKMNLPFVAPESPLFTIFSEAALDGDLTVYSTEDDHFSKPLSQEALNGLLYKIDTVVVWNMDTDEEDIQVVRTDINWEDVRRFRIKESWFFDTNTGTLRVRILGIAPLIDVRDENGDFRFEKPLFWVHYPTARPLLAGHKVITPGGNYSTTTSWEDLFEMRYFASSILKENNVQDLRLQDYLAGTDLLLQAEKIDDELFNREHDLWSW
jgi:gliding motility associated protien GldN